MRELRPLSSLKETAKARPAGYLERCLEFGELDEKTGTVKFTPENWMKIRLEFSKRPEVFSGADIGGFRLGDAVASVATPIARALKLNCIDKKTGQLKPESRCQKWKDSLNKIA